MNGSRCRGILDARNVVVGSPWIQVTKSRAKHFPPTRQWLPSYRKGASSFLKALLSFALAWIVVRLCPNLYYTLQNTIREVGAVVSPTWDALTPHIQGLHSPAVLSCWTGEVLSDKFKVN